MERQKTDKNVCPTNTNPQSPSPKPSPGVPGEGFELDILAVSRHDSPRMFATGFSGQFASLLMLCGAAVGEYVAARAALDAIVPDARPAPGRRAGVHACIAAIICITAVVRRPALLDIAVGVPFSACIAALTLGLGVVLFVAIAPPGLRPLPTSAPVIQRRLWAFILPTALLTVLMGFSGELTTRHAVILAIEGIVLLAFWIGTVPATERDPDAESSGKLGQRIAQTFLAVGLAIISGLAAVEAASGLALHSPIFRPGVAAVLALAPAVVLPMIPPLATLAEQGRRDEAISTVVLFVLANLCAVLPLTVAVREMSGHLHPIVTASTSQPAVVNHDGLPFPITVWRLDAVLLVVIGLLLVPAALGRLNLSRGEGAALSGAYVIYLFLTLLMAHGS